MPKQITKKDIKDAVIEALGPFTKAIQKDFSELKTETDAGFQGVGVTLEHMDKKWDLIAEQYYGIAQRLKDLEERMERHSTLFAEVKIELRFIKQDIAALAPQAKSDNEQKIFSDLEKRIAALEKARK